MKTIARINQLVENSNSSLVSQWWGRHRDEIEKSIKSEVAAVEKINNIKENPCEYDDRSDFSRRMQDGGW